MPQNDTRYDKLRNRLANKFTRSKTIQPAFDAGEQKTLVNLSDYDNTYALDAEFEKFGPFNAVSVRNFSASPIRLYLDSERNAYIDVEADNGATQSVLRRLPNRYMRYLRVENLDNDNPIEESEIQVIVGNDIDGVELDLLEMSGLLNVE